MQGQGVLIAQEANLDHSIEEWWTNVSYTKDDKSVVGVSTSSAYYRLSVCPMAMDSIRGVYHCRESMHFTQ
jgi:hypothetical protein